MSVRNAGRFRARYLVGMLAALPTLVGAAALIPAHGSVPPVRAYTNCDVDSGKLSLDGEERTALDAVNSYRVSQGRPALGVSTALMRIALWKSTDMAAHTYAAHDDVPLGRSYDQRVLDCGYTAGNIEYGENLAGCDPGGVATVTQWKNHPEHNANMLNGDYLFAGIKRVLGPAPSGPGQCWYWTLELGSLADAGLASGGGDAPPPAPQLIAAGQDGSSVQLQWTGVAGASGFEVYNGTDRTMLAPVSGDTQRLTVSGLAPGGYYCFTMYAFNSSGSSSWSGWACASTPPA